MANPLNAHKAESERFPTKSIPCTHTEKGANSSCDICLRVETLNGDVVETRHAFDDAVEQLSVYLDEEINRRYDPIRRLPVELALSIFFLCFPYLASPNIFDVSRAARMDYALRPIPLLLGSILSVLASSCMGFASILGHNLAACHPLYNHDPQSNTS